MAHETQQFATEILADDAAGHARAAELLARGLPVALPTETVYGLAAPAHDPVAVARIYAAKGRPAFNPLIVHVASLAEAETLAHLDARALALAQSFWPGPLTLVAPLRAAAPITPLVTAGLPTLAVRVPAHPAMRAVLALAGPLAAPSANASGTLSPTTAAHVLASLGGRIAAVLDGGPCAAGLESTIVATTPPTLLRAGAIPPEALRAHLPNLAPAAPHAPIQAPGALLRHYAPRAALRLNAAAAHPHEHHIGFGAIPGHVSLSPTGDLTEAAANLFAHLHSADATGHARIAVAPIPHHGLGAAINDRLERAARG